METKTVDVSLIVLCYTCPKCGDKAEQPLTDIMESGTAFCPDCDRDMELDDTAKIISPEMAILLTIEPEKEKDDDQPSA